MSWATCYNGSNNIHHDAPALMSDTRIFTSYEHPCTINKNIRKDNGITSNYNYRKYLQSNAVNIMSYNSNAALNCSNKPCSKASNDNTNKFFFTDCYDRSQPYGYESSDLKNMHLSRTQLASNLSGPILTQEQLLIQRSQGK